MCPGLELGGGQFQWRRHPFRGSIGHGLSWHQQVFWKYFQVGKNDAFEIPLSYVQHCQAQKNEVSSTCLVDSKGQRLVQQREMVRLMSASFAQVTLEFALNEEASVNLSELRFHIPSSEQQVSFVPLLCSALCYHLLI